MKIITTEVVVRRFSDRFSFESEQRLTKEYRLFGLKIWSTVLDTEEVPTWASIQVGCLGYTEWISKFSKYIDHEGSI